MIEQLKTHEAAEAPDEFLRVERGALGDVAENLIVEKNPERRLRRASRLSIALLSTLVAFGVISKPHEVEAQEPIRIATTISKESYDSARIATERFYRYRTEVGLEKIVLEAREQLDYLKSIFREDIDFENFLIYHRIEERLKSINFYLLENLFLASDDQFDSAKAEIDRWIALPRDVIEEIIQHNVEIIGFNKVELGIRLTDYMPELKPFPPLSSLPMTNDMARKVIKKYFSSLWLGSVDKIVYIPYMKIDTLNLSYILGESLFISGRAKTRRLEPRDSVTIFKSPYTYETRYDFIEKQLIPLFLHEIKGHSNSPENSLILSSGEKLRFLYELTQFYIKRRTYSLKEGTHFSISYIDVNEWWAQQVEDYFRDPRKFRRSHSDEFDLIDRWIHYIESKGEVGKVIEK